MIIINNRFLNGFYRISFNPHRSASDEEVNLAVIRPVFGCHELAAVLQVDDIISVTQCGTGNKRNQKTYRQDYFFHFSLL
jgi:hypothetical protein